MAPQPIWFLPNELFITIATWLVSEADMNALILAHSRFHALLNDGLYSRNAARSNSSALLWAARHGKLETAKKAIAAGTEQAGAALTLSLEKNHENVAELLLLIDGIDTEVRTRDGETPLCLAAGMGKRAMVRSLLSKGAIVNPEHSKIHVPLRAALVGKHEEIAMLLLESGASFDDKYVHTAVHIRSEALFRLLLEKGADVNAVWEDDWTVLMEAARSGHQGIVTLLLDAGADVTRSSTRCYVSTAICEMAEHDCEAVVRRLVEKGANVNDVNEYGQTPLMRAARHGREAVARFLIEQGGKINERSYDGMTVLMHAAAGGHEGTTRLLIAHGAPIDGKDSRGRTLLHWAAHGGQRTVLELFLARGLDATAKTDAGESVSMVAAGRGDRDMLARLLALDPDLAGVAGCPECEESVCPCGSTDRGNTILGVAAKGGRLENIKLLLEKGAELEARNAKGDTPLALAAQRGHRDCIEFLLQKGANVETKNEKGDTPLARATLMGHTACIELLVDHGADLEARDQSCRTPLGIAATWDHEACVALLLDRGAEIEARDKRGMTPLGLAVYHGRKACVRILIQRHADIEARDTWGQSPLHVACSGHDSQLAVHRVEMMELLLDCGADIESKDRHGRTPFSLAYIWPASTRAFLRERGAHGDDSDV